MQKHLSVFAQLAEDFVTVRQGQVGPVTLVLAEDKIEIQGVPFDNGNKLHLALISKFELLNGLTSTRWAHIQKICFENFTEKELT